MLVLAEHLPPAGQHWVAEKHGAGEYAAESGGMQGQGEGRGVSATSSGCGAALQTLGEAGADVAILTPGFPAPSSTRLSLWRRLL